MKTIMVFDQMINGHHLEYLHHINERAAVEKDLNFVFVVPELFIDVKSKLSWTESDNIIFDFLSDEECRQNLGFIANCKNASNALRERIERYKPNEVFLVILSQIAPFDLFFLHTKHKTKISGIEYGLLPYMWHYLSLHGKIFRFLEYAVLFHHPRYKSIFILNSKNCVEKLRETFHLKKLLYLTDPITLNEKNGKITRKDLGIPSNMDIVLHIGAMSKRKGTLLLLDAINHLPISCSDKFCFIFAGKVELDIVKEFYEKIDHMMDKFRIIVEDKFCDFEYISSLYQMCDVVVSPYFPSLQSSGVLGNAAFFNKPVIVTKGGFLEDAVVDYKIGYVIDNNTPESICNAMLKFSQRRERIAEVNYSRYTEGHSINLFGDQLFNNFKDECVKPDSAPNG